MKKLFCFFLLVITQASFAQQSENSNSEKQSSSALMQPISVTIGGNFIVTGSFVASRFQRFDHFITSIFLQAQQNSLRGLTQLESMKSVTKEINKYAMRNITLKHVNGEIVKVDLLRFRFTGDFKDNPYLTNDDVIIFPSYDDEISFVEVTGAVNKPTKFQFVPGDKLGDAILFSGGLNQSYENVEKAEISRLDKTGSKEQLITVNIKDNITLESGDRIRILADENQKKNFKVLVLGQVQNPGFVYVTRNGNPLTEVIQKAGGLKENADLQNAEVVRNYNSIDALQRYHLATEFTGSSSKDVQLELQTKRLEKALKFSRLSTLDPDEDTLFQKIDNQLRVFNSGKLVDFTKIYDSNSDESKFLVKDDDLVLIPDKFDYVYVFGQVAKMGYIKYQPGKDFQYYIEKAGGVTETAKSQSSVAIVKGKDLTWISEDKEKVTIDPGDYIYVPKELPNTFWKNFGRVGSVASLLFNAATLVILILQVTK